MLNKPTYGSQSIKTAEEILDRIFDERDYYDRHRILKAMREYADQHNFNHHPLSPEDIKRAASKYAFENNTHRSNSKAFIAGANFAKQPHSNEWVKCCERLPKDFTSVLVSDGNTRTTALYQDGLFYPDFLLEHQEVKYWMPLPHLPKK